MKNYMVCWRDDLKNGFLEEFFVEGSYSLYPYYLIKTESSYDAVDAFLDACLDDAFREDEVYLEEVKEQVVEEFVYLICASDDAYSVIPKRYHSYAEQIMDKYIKECEKRNNTGPTGDDELDEECRNAVIDLMDSDRLIESLEEKEIRAIFKQRHRYDISVIELTTFKENDKERESIAEDVDPDSLWKSS